MFSGLPNTQLDPVAVVAVAILFLFGLFYKWLSPKPIPGVPHNPITSIWGDIPEITKLRKRMTFSEYLADQAYKHGSVYQVGLG